MQTTLRSLATTTVRACLFAVGARAIICYVWGIGTPGGDIDWLIVPAAASAAAVAGLCVATGDVTCGRGYATNAHRTVDHQCPLPTQACTQTSA